MDNTPSRGSGGTHVASGSKLDPKDPGALKSDSSTSVDLSPLASISFTLNNAPVVLEDMDPSSTLRGWLGTQPGLTGTKAMCWEGGCGCCVVAATRADPVTREETTISINSCLCPLYAVDGWHITTVEGIGSSRDGYHPIQEKLAQYNGTQCGYCTPGFVMNMYSLLQSNPSPTKQQIEDNFDGNICRCTGYRAILDAMKTFAVDAEPNKYGFIDIEDLGMGKVCPKTGVVCSKKSPCRRQHSAEQAGASSCMWFRPTSLDALFEIVGNQANQPFKLLVADTGKGVFKTTELFHSYIDLRSIPELVQVQVTESSVVVGAAVPLSNLIRVLLDNQDKSSSFPHIASHLLKIANVPVRNVGSWGGNLMLTHDNDNFPSDMFTIMASVGATVTLASLMGSTWETTSVSLWDFLQQSMTFSVIVSINIPFASSTSVFRSFKVMPRAQNAHAYVNAGFSLEVDPSTFIVMGMPSFVYGGIGTHALAAASTEAYMRGKNMLDVNTLKGALQTLSGELSPNQPPVAASAAYRKSLAISLFYKFYLAVLVGHISPRVQSAAVPYMRPVSEGSQSYTTKPDEYPITEPMTKLTALLQTSGEAQYTTDIPHQPRELAAAFVLTTQANAKIVQQNLAVAKDMPGYVSIITAEDIPSGGQNNFIPSMNSQPEQVLATDFSFYAGQPVAVVLADDQWSADMIAKSIDVQYQSQGKPILTIKDAIAAGSFYPNPGAAELNVGNVTDALASSSHVIEGEVSFGTQYHFHIETQNCLVIPEDEGYTVHASTQWPMVAHAAIATVLNIPESSVNIFVKRVGGAFGAKATRSPQIAAACALASYVSRRPVRMNMDIDSNMKAIGKRFPYYVTYKIGCTDDGIINGIVATVYTNCGIATNDIELNSVFSQIDNAYHIPNWLVTPKACNTHLPPNTFCRSPGTLPGVFIMESMIEHVAVAVGKSAEDVKRANLYKQGQVTPTGMPLTYCNISAMWDELYQSADVAQRMSDVSTFNQANRWRKRGISMVPLRWGAKWIGSYTVYVSIYCVDGSVAVTHGGVEIGQGINTKVAQVAAKTLDIPISMIKVKPTNGVIGPNDFATAASITSELNCLGVLNACNELNDRIAPIKEKNPRVSWQKLVELCGHAGVDLTCKAFVNKPRDTVYNAYGVTVCEVELDVLTGQSDILRVDMLYDCGQSINPEVDIGQAEGAFVMGIGYWLTERVIYDQDSGQLLTHNTWEYKPPCSKDIPIDFRVELLKNSSNPPGILGSKVVGEPPICMSCSTLFAVKEAIRSARAEIGKDDYFTINGPATVEDIQLACMVNPSQFFF